MIELALAHMQNAAVAAEVRVVSADELASSGASVAASDADILRMANIRSAAPSPIVDPLPKRVDPPLFIGGARVYSEFFECEGEVMGKAEWKGDRDSWYYNVNLGGGWSCEVPESDLKAVKLPGLVE